MLRSLCAAASSILLLSACSPSPPPPPAPPALALPPATESAAPPAPLPPAPTATAASSAVAPQSPTDLDPWIALRDLPMRQVMARFSMASTNIRADATYEGLEHLTELHNKAAHPARFFYRDGKIAMIYVGDDDALGKLRGKALFLQMGGEGISLRSRACKPCNEHVYPERGVAFSAQGDGAVHFVEIFPPTTIAGYLKDIYVEPGAFIK